MRLRPRLRAFRAPLVGEEGERICLRRRHPPTICLALYRVGSFLSLTTLAPFTLLASFGKSHLGIYTNGIDAVFAAVSVFHAP